MATSAHSSTTPYMRSRGGCLPLSCARPKRRWQTCLRQGSSRSATSTADTPATFIAAKKDDTGAWSKLRCCQDFRKVNRETKREEHGLPHTDDVFHQLRDSTIFTKEECYRFGPAPALHWHVCAV